MQKDFQLINRTEDKNEILANFDPAILKLSYLSDSVRSFFSSNQEGLKALFEILVKKKKVDLNGYGNLFSDVGVSCQILNPDSPQGWQSGKIRARVYFEFCPDEPENTSEHGDEIEVDLSSLDEIRNLTP